MTAPEADIAVLEARTAASEALVRQLQQQAQSTLVPVSVPLKRLQREHQRLVGELKQLQESLRQLTALQPGQVIDTHCHLQEDAKLLQRMPRIRLPRLMVLMGTRPHDWPLVAQLAQGPQAAAAAVLTADQQPSQEGQAPQSPAERDSVVRQLCEHRPQSANLPREPHTASSQSPSNYSHGAAAGQNLVPAPSANRRLQPTTYLINPPHSRFLPGYGVHPWFINQLTPDWQQELRQRLVTDVSAIVGEIGLDYVARDMNSGEPLDKGHQYDIFQAQMALAVELDRPVSLHCVHAHGALLEALRQAALPPTLALHSFTGKVGLAQQLLALPQAGRRLYFGFSTVINLRPPRGENKHPADAHVRELLAVIPRQQVLLESDQSHGKTVDREVERMVQLFADVWHVTPQAAADLTRENAERWLRGLPASAEGG